ncbi:DUF2813 domain-containing protein [Massilia arenosa]|uniref:DUF2813 domain-containing protein n=2 Tax=Zemynaea arenosa TaxID=2561931 RepID=A0A4Y9RWA4_9BURK|nr:DUF2813 domain-containing protein [Massilia arenosa]
MDMVPEVHAALAALMRARDRCRRPGELEGDDQQQEDSEEAAHDRDYSLPRTLRGDRPPFPQANPERHRSCRGASTNHTQPRATSIQQRIDFEFMSKSWAANDCQAAFLCYILCNHIGVRFRKPEMYLHSLEIRNFRKISRLTVPFSPGLNILLGENNVGKTTIVEALRTLLSNLDEAPVRICVDDLHDASQAKASFRFIFKALTVDQASEFMSAVTLEQDGTFAAAFAVEFEAPDRTGRLKVRRYCGEQDTAPLTTEMSEQLRSVYMPPLRDASRNLKPGTRSLLARLLQRVATEPGLEHCNQILELVDAQLDGAQPIVATREAISSRYNEMLGAQLTQQLHLKLSPQDIAKVTSRLAILADGFEIERNGLGYNNLIYMAAVLGELALADEVAYRCLVVEEPEAHLHPQLQSVLLTYLQAEISRNTQQHVQLFVTTHSPHFAALAQLDCLVRVNERFRTHTAFPLKQASLSVPQKRKLQRYLDITRADLFFARGVILVEGAAERALLPAIAESLGVNLRHGGITVVSTDGLNFDCFQPLFGELAIPIRLATLTDRDPPDIPFPELGQEATTSAAAASSLAMDETFRKTFIGVKTLEYDLALQSAENRRLMLDALSVLHPQISADLQRHVDAQPDNTSAARCLFQGMFERPNSTRNVSKGAFAQELADKIRQQPGRFTAPAYIREAIDWVRIPPPPLNPVPPAPPVVAGAVAVAP